MERLPVFELLGRNVKSVAQEVIVCARDSEVENWLTRRPQGRSPSRPLDQHENQVDVRDQIRVHSPGILNHLKILSLAIQNNYRASLPYCTLIPSDGDS